MRALPGSGRGASRQDAVLTRIAVRSSFGAGAPWFRNHPPGRWNAGIPLPGSCSPPGRRAYSDRLAILVWGGRPMVPESLSRPLECRHSASGIGKSGLPPGRRAYSDRGAILVWGGRPMVPESPSRPLECRHSASGIGILEPHGLSESKLFQESYVVFVEEAHVVDLVF